MSMLTMKDFVPKDPPTLSGETKIFSRLGFIPPSTTTSNRLEEVVHGKVLSTADCPTGSLDLTERFGTLFTVDAGQA